MPPATPPTTTTFTAAAVRPSRYLSRTCAASLDRHVGKSLLDMLPTTCPGHLLAARAHDRTTHPGLLSNTFHRIPQGVPEGCAVGHSGPGMLERERMLKRRAHRPRVRVDVARR